MKRIILLLALLTNAMVYAKVQTNWGKPYDITSGILTTIPNSTQDVTIYLNTRLLEIIADINASYSPTTTDFTIVFPARNYICSGTVNFDLSTYTTGIISGATINIIGLSTNYNDGDLLSLLASNSAYINTHYAGTHITSNGNVSSPSFLSSAPSPMAKFIYDFAANSTSLPALFNLKNSSPSIGVIHYNTINMMGFEIQGEAFNQWTSLQPHPSFNSANCHPLIGAHNWENVYIDNNYLHDHYSGGISIGVDYSSIQTQEVEIRENVINNVYAFRPTGTGSSYDDCGDGI